MDTRGSQRQRQCARRSMDCRGRSNERLDTILLAEVGEGLQVAETLSLGTYKVTKS